MRSIDVHAHLTPQSCIRALQAGKEWHGIKPGDVRISPRAAWTPEQRIADMNSLGVDVHVVSTGAGFYFYDRDVETVTSPRAPISTASTTTASPTAKPPCAC